MNRLIFVMVATIAVAIGLLVGTLNSDRVFLDLLWVQLEWPLGLLILFSLAIGLLIGISLSYLSRVIPLRMKLRKLQAEAKRAENRIVTGTDA